MSEPGIDDRSRVVLLGASNLTRAISTVVQTARLVLGGPLDVLAALGAGRSYGTPSTLCGRTLPGIVDCGLWAELATGDRGPVYALMTDIGNDIAYGQAPTEITGWLEQCLDRLEAANARIVITGLPLESISSLGPLRYRLAKTLLFPFRRLSLDEAVQKARTLDESVRRLARHYDAAVVDLPRRWYGVDPIHIRLRHWPETWSEVLAPWNRGEPPPRAAPSPARWLRLRTAVPASFRVLGCELGQSQPARRLSDGTTLSVY